MGLHIITVLLWIFIIFCGYIIHECGLAHCLVFEAMRFLPTFSLLRIVIRFLLNYRGKAGWERKGHAWKKKSGISTCPDLLLYVVCGKIRRMTRW